jgi:hypothetical protein
MLSIADVQWVLHRAEDACTIEAEVVRGTSIQKLSFSLPSGWRRKDDFSWRVIAWSMRHRLLGTQPLESVPAAERAGLPATGMALRVKGFPPNWVKEKNPDGAKQFKVGDVITGVDGQSGLVTESDLLGYLFQKKAPGSTAAFSVVRAGKAEKIALQIP